ncbi:MAG: hypothetical protein ACSHX6_10805 [Akkermansiaceae bacterium]
MIRILTLILCIGLTHVNVASASGKKAPPVSITFHLEASSLEGKKLSIPAKTPMGTKYIQKSPSFTTKDFIAYYPFVSPHENEMYGVTLQLRKTAATRLKMISAANKGKYIVVNINGRVVDMLFVDKMVDGRVITIWRGVDPQFLALVNPLIPKIGEDPKDWKKRLKLEKKAAKAKR